MVLTTPPKRQSTKGIPSQWETPPLEGHLHPMERIGGDQRQPTEGRGSLERRVSAGGNTPHSALCTERLARDIAGQAAHESALESVEDTA